ncbi:probable 2-oxoacid dependent dioxygenase [Miscanthus floridulus]|uniref:probable 2-oxoacid dependent dioxygenase n=1 Tax=Miscanthus floridulus TaxID=154761 RepID=UPI00345AE004
MSTTEEAAGGYGYDCLSKLKAFDDTKAGDKGLVDAGVTTVPAIFRHHHQDGPQVSPSSSSGCTISVIPVIDLSAASAADVAARAEVVAQVKAVAETVGFFQLVNHVRGRRIRATQEPHKVMRNWLSFPKCLNIRRMD